MWGGPPPDLGPVVPTPLLMVPDISGPPEGSPSCFDTRRGDCCVMCALLPGIPAARWVFHVLELGRAAVLVYAGGVRPSPMRRAPALLACAACERARARPPTTRRRQMHQGRAAVDNHANLSIGNTGAQQPHHRSSRDRCQGKAPHGAPRGGLVHLEAKPPRRRLRGAGAEPPALRAHDMV